MLYSVGNRGVGSCYVWFFTYISRQELYTVPSPVFLNGYHLPFLFFSFQKGMFSASSLEYFFFSFSLLTYLSLYAPFFFSISFKAWLQWRLCGRSLRHERRKKSLIYWWLLRISRNHSRGIVCVNFPSGSVVNIVLLMYFSFRSGGSLFNIVFLFYIGFPSWGPVFNIVLVFFRLSILRISC